jgi:Calcineurin-like phosphoesterase superfamily domain
MKLLAFSDIHHNLMAVRELRALERNSFDAIAVAGDIGGHSAAEFFQIMTTFECPVLYVYGNWDAQLGYDVCYGPDCHLVQGDVTTVENFSFTGFSGCPTNWGQNPIAQKLQRALKQAHRPVIEALERASSMRAKGAKISGGETARDRIEKIKQTRAYQNYSSEMRLCKSETLRLNRESIGNAVRKAKADPRKCIVIAHERIPLLHEELPGALLHLFGHLHQFSVRDFKGTRCVDVAALDRTSPIRFKGALMNKPVTPDAGNYAKIEISRSYDVKVTCMPLRYDDRAINTVTRKTVTRAT